jgi:hypothetical protein
MNKVRLLVDPLLGDGTAAQLASAVATLDSAANLDALFALCAPAGELNHA